jgi:hypothetical protein
MEGSQPAAGSKRAERPEQLGWLTESGVMPKKKREIEGVGASSLVDLQAQLFRAQVCLTIIPYTQAVVGSNSNTFSLSGFARVGHAPEHVR